MKTPILIFLGLLYCSLSYGQRKVNTEELKIKKAVLEFLNWHMINESINIKKIDSTKVYHPIIVRKQVDTMTKVVIDMLAVEHYLDYLRSSKVISETFLNNLRQYHQKIADEVAQWKPYPTKEGIFAIPGLNCDVIFGCEPEEILDHIKEGKFSKIYRVYHKALIKFDVTRIHQYVFTLSKPDGRWLIDSFGFDSTNLENMNKQSRGH